MKQTIQKLLTVGIVLVCAALNLQYLPAHAARAAVNTDPATAVQTQTRATAAHVQQQAGSLRVVTVVDPTVATSTTIQETAEPSAVSIVPLQSAGSAAVAMATATPANLLSGITATALSVQPVVSMFSFARDSEPQTLQQAIVATTAPVHDAALLPNAESSALNLVGAGIALMLAAASVILITKESKGFALSDRTTVLRC